MKSKHSGRLIFLTVRLIILYTSTSLACIFIMLSLFHIIIFDVLTNIFLLIFAVSGSVASIIQNMRKDPDYPEAMRQIHSIGRAMLALFIQLLRKLWHLPKGIVYTLLILSIIFLILLPNIRTMIQPASPTIPAVPKFLFSYPTPDGLIGISDGRYAFDVNTRLDPPDKVKGYQNGNFKLKAANAVEQANDNEALHYWREALNGNDSNDAEVLIYQEDWQVVSAHRPHITLIVVTQLTGSHQEYMLGRANLQGAYTAQKEFNHQSKSFLLNLLVANVGDQDQYAQMVAEHIQDLYKQDYTIKGVVGWPQRTNSINQAIQKICGVNIPIVTISANDIIDQNYCAYNFSIVPSNEAQLTTAIDYIKKVLNKKRISIIYDPSDDYSLSLYNLFIKHYHDQSAGTSIVDREAYSIYSRDSLPALIRATLQGDPDLIFFAGYSLDLNTVLRAIPASSHIDVLGANAIYQNQQGLLIGQSNLYFTAFAYPDEWSLLKQPEPAFFQDYANYFDPNNKYKRGIYGYTRANDSSMIAYDAVETILTTVETNFQSDSFTLRQLQGALRTNTYNGVTGLIKFDNQGNADKKPVVIIQLDSQLNNQYRGIQGCYTAEVCYGS